MLVVMTVRTVLKVPLEKAAPPCPFDVPAPLDVIADQGRRQLREIRGAKLKTGGGGKVLTVNYCNILTVK